MELNEAIDVCNRWIDHVDSRRAQSVEVQRLAAMSRNGQGEEARKRLAAIDKSPTVFDGDLLEQAVRRVLSVM